MDRSSTHYTLSMVVSTAPHPALAVKGGPRSMRAWYLTTPEQDCSVSILQELGVKAGSAAEVTQALASVEEIELSQDHLGPAFKETAKELKRECKLAHEDGVTAWVVKQGRVYIDTRDSADEWIRISLGRGDALALPNKAWRRLVLTDDPFVVVERFTTPEDNKAATSDASRLSLHVKTYRFQSPDDERQLELELSSPGSHDIRQLIVDLCKQFYDLQWVTGTGGSISIRHGNRVYMTPSGVQKERMLPDELYVLDMSGNQLYTPEPRPGRAKLKLTACAPLFFHSYRIRDAGAVIHSHGMECVLATLLFDGQKEFRITHQEMIKGIVGHGYLSELVVPIIENTPHEEDLADSLGEAIRNYPKTTAVLVRRHGIYIWGATWMQAKTQAECYHYLFKLAVEMHRLGMDWTKVPDEASTGPEKAAVANGCGSCCKASTNGHTAIKHVLMDIEGTTTSISFVHKTLFPYARTAVAIHVRQNMGDPETEADIEALRIQAQHDVQAGVEGVPLIPSPTEATSDDERLYAVVTNVEWQMAADRKTTALKQLQGHIWRAGYMKGLLKGHVYEDVPPAFERWTKRGLKLSIYSSGSREAQSLLFGHTEFGDLRPYIGCYFDTTTGPKRERGSYASIALSLGVDHPGEVLFLTDIAEEALAAKEAGMQVILSVRPGNGPLTLGAELPRVTSFGQVDAYIDSFVSLPPRKVQ